MSLPRIILLVALVAGCGGSPRSDEPTTAREKQLRDARAAGEEPDYKDKPKSRQRWGKWRYTGDRDDCFYIVGARCFKAQHKACAAARCRPGTKCITVGAGPAQIKCQKPS